ncbi:MAG: hypothetical protein EAX89_10905 [Candidatus Lokiarchaeota archaeon]|nr:hypothetical protein [Candidatus Lokiarchaeota archaeon]
MDEEVSDEGFWKFVLKKHWLKLIPFILIAFGAFISGVYVFLWHNEIGGYWNYTFNDWSFAAIWVYLFWFALREFLLVALPTLAVFGIIFGIIWFTMSEDLRAELKERGKREDKKEEKDWWKKKGKPVAQGGGFGGFSVLVMIAFLIIVFVDGNWEVSFDNLPLIYFVRTFITAMIWIAIIFGIPATIGIIFWLWKKLK